MKHRIPAFSLLALILTAVSLQSCGGSESPSLQREGNSQKLTDLKRQKENAVYELQLRQDELDKMEASVKRPGVVGVSKEWLERKNKLQEEITRLKVRIHDLDLQISGLGHT